MKKRSCSKTGVKAPTPARKMRCTEEEYEEEAEEEEEETTHRHGRRALHRQRREGPSSGESRGRGDQVRVVGPGRALIGLRHLLHALPGRSVHVQQWARRVRRVLRAHPPQVLVLRRAHRRRPVPAAGERPRRDEHLLPVQAARLRRDRPVRRPAGARGGLPARALRLPRRRLTYRGLPLYRHVLDDHADAVANISYLRSSTVTLRKSAPSRVLVHAGRERVFALLNGGSVLGGRSLSLVCVGPRPEGGVELSYKMEVRAGAGAGAGAGEPGALSLAGTVSCARRLEEAPEPKGFLFVPNAYWGPSGTVSVSVRIG